MEHDYEDLSSEEYINSNNKREKVTNPVTKAKTAQNIEIRNQSESNEAEEPKAEEPIFLRTKEQLPNLKEIVNAEALNKENVLKIKPISSDNYRKITKFLTQQNAQYHTYALNEDKPLKVVITT